MPEESSFPTLKRLLVGKPIPSHLAHHERLSRVTGLAVLSSDALSSVAYATDFIVATLIVAGTAALGYAIPIGLVIAALLAVVAFSYRQTIYAYPTGGGAYRVAKENIGENAGLTAAASLLVDYTLTVSVSISAGVLAITSAFPSLDVYRVQLCLVFLTLLTLGNLRGIRESGQIFAIPTYFFVVSIFVLIAIGLYHYATGTLTSVAAPVPDSAGTRQLTTLLLLTAFANGCTAMTGVEAVSDGVPAFRPPESKNAAATLVTMAVLAIAMFLGITFLAHAYQVMPTEKESGVSQLGRVMFGTGPVYYLVQAATTLILVLAANTAYADFPRLASIVSRDRFLPRQFMNQGDRLAFSNGILVLSAFAALLMVVFKGDTHALLPLYMIGVFVSFTLSQTGMVIHWRKKRTPGWKTSALVNGFGAVVTGVVLVIVAITKTLEGAWIVLLLIPIIIALCKATRRHYDHVASQLTLRNYTPQRRVHNTVLMPVGGLQRAVVEALRYAETLSDDVRAVYVDVDQSATDQMKKDWETWGGKAKLVILESPFRSVMEPLLEYIEQVENERTDDYVTVILPEFVPARWWQHLLHNQRALLIKGALLFRPNTVVTSVPFHLAK
ncbi:MAG: amino acid permease [Acidobacteria bacterium 13_1_40CM_65_14]|nr:MAG: amino acid permease [Acidobacteria bacterium 13_1_40CM_65_14]OLE85575.1 MAG: amino acid permease [Acidobacteria bacterium 13_1_20CM_2_65_9]